MDMGVRSTAYLPLIPLPTASRPRAASGHIDARIVDAAHLLAEKTYGDEIDPSKLTPRERRRLERAKLAVHEYRRRMLELYARDEAQDDDGK